MELQITYLSTKIGKEIAAPAFASAGAAGIDLAACMDQPLALPPNQHGIVPTGVAVAIPEQHVGLVYVRSSMGFQHGITLSNAVGVIDSDYRGELKVSLFNASAKEYVIQPGERIAQLVITPICIPNLRVVEDLPQTARGTGGVGSTGKF